MEMPSLAGLAGLSSLEGLTDIGLHGGPDMRPTLLRVLTDLYMQKLRHTPDEERHYTELALRLLESVDAPTRAAVAARLARHLSPPPRVIQYLVNDLPEIAAPLRSHPLLLPPDRTSVTALQAAALVEEPETEFEQAPVVRAQGIMDAASASELTELFFAADSNERCLILQNLDVVAPIPAGGVSLPCDPAIGQHLEAAALTGNREEFARHLALCLQIPREQARRLARDNLGEPIVVAAKALKITRDLLYRILMFANPAVGHSVERVHALAALFDTITLAAAEGMIAIWQALDKKDDRVAPKYRPVVWNDETRLRARSAAATRRTPVAPQIRERRGTP
jgi:hypothetical protein